MTALAAILRPVSFIGDPVPHVDRKPAPQAPPRSLERVPRVVRQRIIARDGIVEDVVTVVREDPWLHGVDWSPLDTAPGRHPRSTAARLRPYDWSCELAWPVDGWGLS